ncbi:armadillo repeat-containing protein 6 [Pycnococcus provasolii]
MPSAINAPGRWDVFLSHTRRNDAAVGLAEKMFRSLEKNHELGIWLDVEMPKRDEAAMVEGASNCDMLIAIVTKGPSSPDDDYLKRDFCLKELRAAKAAGVAIQPVHMRTRLFFTREHARAGVFKLLHTPVYARQSVPRQLKAPPATVRVEDKHRINEFFADLPDDLTYLRGVDVIDLNRNDADYWNVGMQKVVDRLNEAKSAKTRGETGDEQGMHADALQLLQGMHLDKYADALFEMGVVTKEDLSLVDEDVMSEVGFSTLEKKKFLKRRPPSARPTSRAPESSISTVRRGQAAIDSFKAQANWRKVAHVREAATRLHMLSVDAKAGRAAMAREKAKEIESYRQQAVARESAKTSTSSKSAIDSIKEAEGRNNVNAIIETMKLNVADADVQEQACRAFVNLTRDKDNSENQSRIAQAGGIEAVVSAMKRHENNANVQEQACRALGNLSYDHPENKSRIGQAGGIEAVLRAMKRHENNADLQEQACRALGNLSYDHPENKSRIGQAGGIEAVVTAMKRHENHTDVQENACKAFIVLSYDHPENQSRIRQAGGIEAVVTAMKRHENHTDVQENACKAFIVLSHTNPENQSRIRQAGGIEAVVMAMKRPENHKDVQENACRAFINLSHNNPENQSRIRQAGGIEAVLSAMKRPENHKDVQEYACWTLRILSQNNSENQSRIAQVGGIEAVVSALKRHENNAGVQGVLCVVLYNTSSNAEYKRRAIDAGAIPAIEAARRNHPKNNQVQTMAADALGRLRS